MFDVLTPSILHLYFTFSVSRFVHPKRKREKRDMFLKTSAMVKPEIFNFKRHSLNEQVACYTFIRPCWG
jgi:hypothetical protein